MIGILLLSLQLYAAVPSVDLSRYTGTWYEIARLPNRFQNKCTGEVSARYDLRPDGRLSVVNRCRVAGGTFAEARGVARPAGRGRPNSMLKVRFAPAFLSFLPQVWGDYHVLALAPDYSYTAVGSPSLRYLWILSRTPEMDPAVYRQLLDEMRQQGFDTARVVRTDPGPGARAGEKRP